MHGSRGKPAREREDTRRADAEHPADFAINAKVRQVLARRWVRTQGLEVGTTNGVVLIKGRLEREPGGLAIGGGTLAHERFMWRLKSELRAIPGVADVVLDLHEMERTDAP